MTRFVCSTPRATRRFAVLARLCSAVLICLILPCPVRSQNVRKQDVRDALKMPSVGLLIGIGFNSKGEFHVAGDAVDGPAEIVRVQAQLRGTSADADTYRRLSDLLSDAKKVDEARQALDKAAALCREQLQANPKDARVRCKLAGCLQTTTERQTIERLLGEAVALAPTDWQCLMERSKYHVACANDAIVDGKMSFNARFSDGQFRDLAWAKNVTPAAAAVARRSFQLARADLDRAVAVAPKDPEPYRKRAISLCWMREIDAGLRPVLKEAGDAREQFNADIVQDLQTAVRLDPDDYYTIGWLMFFQFAAEAERLKIGPMPGDSRLWHALPEHIRKSMVDSLAALHRLSRNTDPKKAAAAFEIIGCFRILLLGEPAQALEDFQQALKLDPSRDAVWDMLTGLLAISGQPAASVRVAEERLKHKDNAHSRFLLARSLEDAKQLDKAEEQVQIILKREPRDVRANLGLAVLRLKQPVADAPAFLQVLAQAKKQLDVVEKLLTPDAEPARIDFLITQAAYHALSDKLAMAEKSLAEARQLSPQNDRI